MNGGIHDGINLADKLARVIHGEAGEELLDLYSRQRRHAAVKYVQAQTIANKRLMEERDPAVAPEEFRRTAPHRRQPRHRQGLHAPRRAARQPARRRRRDMNGILRLSGGKRHIGPVTPIVSGIIEQARLAARAFAEFGGQLFHPTRAARRDRAVARRQDRVHHRAGARPRARRPFSGVRATGGAGASPARGCRRSPTTPCRASTTRRHVRVAGRPSAQWPRIDPPDQRAARRHRLPVRRTARGMRTLTLDIVDYPGEWLLDLPLLVQELRAMVGARPSRSRAADRRVAARRAGMAALPRSIRWRRPTRATAIEAARQFTGYLPPAAASRDSVEPDRRRGAS